LPYFSLVFEAGEDDAQPSFSCASPDVTSTEFGLTIEGTTATITFPFAALPGAPRAAIAPGARLDAFSMWAEFDARETSAGLIQAARRAVDYARAPVDDSWTVGSDVPPSVDCTSSPSHPDCL
jgi:hypothetical protein